MFAPQTKVQYEGRPAIVITAPAIGATGVELVGIRFTDVERWADCPGFPGMKMPAPGSSKIAPTSDLVAV